MKKTKVGKISLCFSVFALCFSIYTYCYVTRQINYLVEKRVEDAAWAGKLNWARPMCERDCKGKGGVRSCLPGLIPGNADCVCINDN